MRLLKFFFLNRNTVRQTKIWFYLERWPELIRIFVVSFSLFFSLSLFFFTLWLLFCKRILADVEKSVSCFIVQFIWYHSSYSMHLHVIFSDNRKSFHYTFNEGDTKQKTKKWIIHSIKSNIIAYGYSVNEWNKRTCALFIEHYSMIFIYYSQWLICHLCVHYVFTKPNCSSTKLFSYLFHYCFFFANLKHMQVHIHTTDTHVCISYSPHSSQFGKYIYIHDMQCCVGLIKYILIQPALG